MNFKALLSVAFAAGLLSGCAAISAGKGQNLTTLEAKQIFKQHFCEDKSPSRCNDIGVEFELAKDFKNAEIYYKKACESELGVACSNLGSLYQKFDESEIKSQALRLFLKACELDSKYGCYNAANSFRLGTETDHNFVRAIKLYEKACIELKHSKSCTNLGGMHQFSLGVEGGSRDVARKYYKMGCELGDEVGCKNFSLLEDKF